MPTVFIAAQCSGANPSAPCGPLLNRTQSTTGKTKKQEMRPTAADWNSGNVLCVPFQLMCLKRDKARNATI